MNSTMSPGENQTSEFIYSQLFGTELAMPEWEALVTILFLSMVIIITIVGNILVIISVLTYTPLKITPNYFIVSLAMADLTVSVCVLPFNVASTVLGRWVFGSVFCKMWLTSDVLCCTASILNLCAIALDRYYALHDPIQHAQRRTVKFVLGIIVLVWLISCVICSPPLFGWNDWPDDWTDETECTLTSQKGYVIYSSMGSFYIPLAIIIFVYIKIFQKTRKRLRKRAEASNLKVLAQTTSTRVNTTRTGGVKVQVVSNGSASNLSHPGEPAIVAITEGDNGAKNSSVRVINQNLRNSPDPQPNLKTPICQELSSTMTPEVDMHRFINEKAKISLSKERKAARTMAVVVTTFIVCWLPFFLMYVILPFCGEKCTASAKLMNFITWLGYINSTLNPIIYTIFNMDFRVAFKKTISCM